MGYPARIGAGVAALMAVSGCAGWPNAPGIPQVQERSLSASDLLAEPLPAPASTDWRLVDPEDLLLIKTRHGVTAIELDLSFAPNHAARMRDLVRAGFYNGEYFYRVIDGFVAQAGVQHDDRMSDWPPLQNENDRARSFETLIPLGNEDLFTDEVGHTVRGFSMGRDRSLGREWLLHCPGAMAMARDEDPNTGGTEFYIVLDAQRYLDRNLTIFGRVIDGMEHIQALERGDRAVESGVIQPPRTGDEILSATLAADLPDDLRPEYYVMKTNRQAFEEAKRAKRIRAEPFFYRRPPAILDICGFDVPVKRTR
ncbi:MAG: peptidylprolyl isomerase [Pseudomonadota bacterium]